MRILSSRKIIVSKPELKHTNDKIIINLYIFNRQNNYYLKKIRKILRLNYLKKKMYEKKFFLLSNVYKKLSINILKEKDILIKMLNINKIILSKYKNIFKKRNFCFILQTNNVF